MVAAILFAEHLEIPLNIAQLAEFRKWVASDSFPETGRIDFLDGRIEVDMSPEDLHTHGKVKVALLGALWQWISAAELGELYADSTRVACPTSGLSVEPDIVLVRDQTLDSGRVRLVPSASGRPDRYVELCGAPDLVVEIVSDASVRKDTERLPAAYFAAGVDELWLVDARVDPLMFRVLRRGPDQFVSAPSTAQGYQLSGVLGRWCRLERSRNRHGRLEYRLCELVD
jgi:Uma2 family endonuclease